MRVAVYTDYSYRQAGGSVYGERAFVLFLAHVARSVDRMVLLGRLDPSPGKARYALPAEIDFVALPHYESQLQPLRLASALVRSLGRFWRALDDVDVVWLLGPHPVALAFAALAAARRKPVVLGVRQDLPRYTRSRHPGRRWAHAAAALLELAWRGLARRLDTVVVGPALARRYRASRALLALSVSLVHERDLAAPGSVERGYDGELVVLSVGRLETEKNPLLLADVLARLLAADDRWRLVVCGEGPLERELRERLGALGIEARAQLRGYVPLDGGLLDLYRSSHAFLHVSWTEGLPQVLWESFAATLPVVATAVGGVPEAVDGAALLVPPGDCEAAATALERVASDEALRARMADRGAALARSRTIEAESGRLLEFLARARS